MIININKTSPIPIRGTDQSAGYDIVATSDPIIIGEKNDRGGWNRIEYIQYHTGIFAYPESNIIEDFGCIHYHILFYPRSSICKYNLSLCNGVGLGDRDYRGEYLVRFNYLWQPEDMYMFEGQSWPNGCVDAPYISYIPNMERIYKKGDKICQLVIANSYSVDFNPADELSTTGRGSGGFGSTGK